MSVSVEDADRSTQIRLTHTGLVPFQGGTQPSNRILINPNISRGDQRWKTIRVFMRVLVIISS